LTFPHEQAHRHIAKLWSLQSWRDPARALPDRKLYKIAHSWLDPVVNPVQTALGCPLN
jgi:hypothetical protein